MTKQLLIASVLFSSLAAIGTLIYLSTRKRPDDSPGGFRDWVKNPDYKRAVTEQMAADKEERASLTVPNDISDSDIQAMVDRLFERDDRNGLNVRRLELIGRKAYPSLVRAFDDPRIAQQFQPEQWVGYEAKFPLERVVGLLKPLDEPLVIRTLAKYARHPDDWVRKYAALELGAIGSPECLDPVVTALQDEDEYVRSYAMMGIAKAVKERRASRDFQNGVFMALVKLIGRTDIIPSRDAPGLLLAIDTERALPILLSPPFLTAQNPGLYSILEALNNAKHRVPHDKLLPLLKELKPLIAEFPYNSAYAAALMAYALNPDPAAEETFREGLQSSQDRVQEAAGAALATLAGTGDPIQRVFDAERQRGFDALSEPQRLFFAALIYDGEVNNGGHSQYFVNSSGDQWRFALDGMKAIGASERAEILEQAVGLFEAKGPSDDGETRHEQLASSSKRKDEALARLDDRYYASKENVAALLAPYAIDNREAFR